MGSGSRRWEPSDIRGPPSVLTGGSCRSKKLLYMIESLEVLPQLSAQNCEVPCTVLMPLASLSEHANASSSQNEKVIDTLDASRNDIVSQAMYLETTPILSTFRALSASKRQRRGPDPHEAPTHAPGLACEVEGTPVGPTEVQVATPERT